MVGGPFSGEEPYIVGLYGTFQRCPTCKRLYQPTDRQADALAAGEAVPECAGCYVARAYRRMLYGAVLLIVLGGLCLMLTGCAVTPGAWGNGPSGDGVTDEVHGAHGRAAPSPLSPPARGGETEPGADTQQELERIRRERGAAKMSQREAEHALQRMIGSR